MGWSTLVPYAVCACLAQAVASVWLLRIGWWPALGWSALANLVSLPLLPVGVGFLVPIAVMLVVLRVRVREDKTRTLWLRVVAACLAGDIVAFFAMVAISSLRG